MSRIDKCGKCGRPFYVSEVGGQMPGTKEREDIRCPHCGDTTQETSNGVFRTSELSSEAEAAWIAEQDQSQQRTK